MLALIALAACGGGDDGSGPTKPDPQPKPPTVASVTVAPATVSLQPRQTSQLTATPLDSVGGSLSGRTVTWSSANPAVADVSSSGLVTAVAPGTATMTATIEGKSATAAITVTPATVATVSVTPATATLEPKQTAQLTARALDATSTALTDRKLTWTTSSAAVATVNDSGRVTAVAPGSATITATSDGKSGSAAITVNRTSVASVRIAPKPLSLEPPQTRQLSVLLQGAFGDTLTGRTITWASSNAAIATVSTTGLVTAVAIGSTSITATSEGKTDTAQVTIALAPVATVVVTAPSTVVIPTQKLQLNAALRDSTGRLLTGRAVDWSSSAPQVATVDKSTGQVTGVAPGAATITALSEGRTGTLRLTVSAGTVVGTAGGTITSSDSAVTIVVPAGAVPVSTPVLIQKVTESLGSAPTGSELNGSAYRIGPAGLTFSKPVTVSVRFDPQTLPKWTMGGDLRLFRLVGGGWVAMGNPLVDAIKGTVGTTINSTGAAIRGMVRPASLGDGLFPFPADEDESGLVVRPGVNWAAVNLEPSSGSVNFQKRYVEFTAGLKPIGEPITLPAPSSTPTPLWKFRWRTTGQNGTMGGGKVTGWTTNQNEQYIATNPNLNTLRGEIDKVYVDVLLNPSEENNPSAWKITTREASVDADLKTTYEIVPADGKVNVGEDLTLRLVMRAEDGQIIEPGKDTKTKWASSGNHGKIRNGSSLLTAIYAADANPKTLPPRVDDVTVEVEAVAQIEHRDVVWEFFPLPPKMRIVRQYTESRTLQGSAKAFVTVDANYKAVLSPESTEMAPGDNKTFTVTLDPPFDDPRVQYKWSVIGNRGTIDVGSGRTPRTSVTYTAKTNATAGTDRLKVDVVTVLANTELGTIATGEAAIEISNKLQGSCTADLEYTGTAWARAKWLIIPKVMGATSYIVTASLHDGSEYNRTITGATTTNKFQYNGVTDAGSSFRINLASGVGQNQGAQQQVVQAYMAECASTSVLYKVQ